MDVTSAKGKEMKHIVILQAIIGIMLISGCNSAPTTSHTNVTVVDGRSFKTEESNKRPIVVYYQMIPKTLLSKFIRCEKYLNKQAKKNGTRPIHFTTDKMEYTKAHFSTLKNYFSVVNVDVIAARTNLEQCVSGLYGKI